MRPKRGRKMEPCLATDAQEPGNPSRLVPGGNPVEEDNMRSPFGRGLARLSAAIVATMAMLMGAGSALVTAAPRQSVTDHAVVVDCSLTNTDGTVEALAVESSIE